MDLDGDNDYDTGANLFTQDKFFFLFDKEMKFSERKNFKISEDLEAKEYIKMRKINRNKLYEFLMDLKKKQGNNEFLNQAKEIIPGKNWLDKEGNIDDEVMYTTLLMLLKQFQFGFFLKEVSGHIEYFMNTLNTAHKARIINPFEMPDQYQAFHYTATFGEGMREGQRDKDELIDYDLIDDGVNVTPENSGFKDIDMNNATPVNNKIEAPKLSVKQQIRRKSQLYVRRLSVLQQHQMVFNPTNFSTKMNESMNASDQDLVTFKQSSKICHKIVKKSIGNILGENWYPNHDIASKRKPQKYIF